MEDMLDFDLFLRETRKEPLEVHVYGQSIPVPPAIPALVPVMMARSEHMQDSEAAALVVKAADALFTREKVDWMCDMGMSTEDYDASVYVLEPVHLNTNPDDYTVVLNLWLSDERTPNTVAWMREHHPEIELRSSSGWRQ